MCDYKNHLNSNALKNYFHLDVQSLCELCKVQYIEGDMGSRNETKLSLAKRSEVKCRV